MKTFKEHINESKATDIIHVFDLDDSLVFTDSKIYYTEPEQPQKTASTGEFAKIRSKLHKNTKYDWKDFHETKNSYMGIVKGRPNIPVLRLLDKAIASGSKIGILTARGNQSSVLAAVKDWLLYKNSEGDLKKMPREIFKKKYCFAVGDLKTMKALGHMGGSLNPQDLKAYVLREIFGNKYGFKRIVFIDDDELTINTVDNLNDSRITTIKV